jgi:translation initiation factor IF-3
MILDAGSIPAISTLIFNTKTIRRTYRKFVPKQRGPLTQINEYIRAREVRVIDENGVQLGIMPPSKAVEIAKERGLDLVEISPNAKPPVCKILEYGKFQYQKSKEDRQNKSKQKKFDIKGIRIGIRTDDHDLAFKKAQAEKFLAKGNKVKIEIILRGREKAHQDLGRKTLVEFLKNIAVPNKIEQELKRFPGGFNVIITPN